MIPFLSASGTSFQLTKIEVEVVSFSLKSLGGALGTENYNFIRHEITIEALLSPLFY